MPKYIAPEHLHNRAMRRWFAKYGPTSAEIIEGPYREWPMARMGPTRLGWYWHGIATHQPMNEIVIGDGKVVAIR